MWVCTHNCALTNAQHTPACKALFVYKRLILIGLMFSAVSIVWQLSRAAGKTFALRQLVTMKGFSKWNRYVSTRHKEGHSDQGLDLQIVWCDRVSAGVS